MYSNPFLQSVICPICRYAEKDQLCTIRQMHGTGFLITESGLFMTAGHVLKAAEADAKKNGDKVGIFPMQLVDGEKRSLTARILEHEFADDPFDIAVFRTEYHAETFLKLEGLGEIEVWQDVGTTGYPISVAQIAGEKYELQQRAHKGYIQRIIPAERMRLGKHPDVFELSFPITHGLSGSPLFIHRPKDEWIIGVCVGSINSRIVDFETVLMEEGELKQKEQIMRVEEFGIAHDIRPLYDWKPKLLAGMSLKEASIRRQ
jgi:hypothetical protein